MGSLLLHLLGCSRVWMRPSVGGFVSRMMSVFFHHPFMRQNIARRASYGRGRLDPALRERVGKLEPAKGEASQDLVAKGFTSLVPPLGLRRGVLVAQSTHMAAMAPSVMKRSSLHLIGIFNCRWEMVGGGKARTNPQRPSECLTRERHRAQNLDSSTMRPGWLMPLFPTVFFAHGQPNLQPPSLSRVLPRVSVRPTGPF